MSRHIRVGITHGDMNGIGYEVIIKALDDELMPELFTPVIFGSDKAMAFYRKALGCEELRVRRVASAAEASDNAVNLVDVMTEDVKANPGVPDEAAGRAALLALEAACAALEAGEIDALVTAPIDKNTIHGEGFDFPGHTEYLEARFRSEEDADGGKALMILFNEMLRVALVTTHLPVSKIAEHITAAAVTDTVERFAGSLRRDFRCERPRIAVLGLNPHCGDHGIAGDEDDTVIRPAVDALRERGIMAFGPYAADGFFGSGAYRKFDGVVAMYHDQGLAPFKTIAGTDGVNFTAGLKYVRTSPDHGTGYDIAGKGVADPLSMRHAIYAALDILRSRRDFDHAARNPLKPLQERKAKDKPKEGKEAPKETKEQKQDAPATPKPAEGDKQQEEQCTTE